MRRIAILVALSFAAGAAGGQNVFVVDAANGPGTNFVDLPTAVAAAASGDRIEVRAGHYAPFHVSGKALRITGAGSALTIIDGPPNGAPGSNYVTVDGVPAGSLFRIEGIAIRSDLSGGQAWVIFPPSSIWAPVASRLSVGASVGAVVLNDLDVGPATTPPSNSADGRGLNVDGAAVHADRCSFRGGGYALPTLGSAFVGAGEGGLIQNAGVLVANDCIFQGGSVNVSTAGPSLAVWGGTGLTVSDADARLFGGSVSGGSANALGNFLTNANSGNGAVVVGTSALRVAGLGTVSGGIAYASLPTHIALGAAYLCQAPAVVDVHVPVVSATNGGAVSVGTGIVGLAQTRLPYLACFGTPRPDGALEAAQPAFLLLSEPNLPGAVFVLFLSGGPGFSKPFPTLMANELLISDLDVPLFVGNTNAFGAFSYAFTAAALFPGALDVPLHVQGAVIDAAQNLALMSNATVRVFK